MQPFHDFKVQRLFLTAAVLKGILAFLGWAFNSPWALGFGAPLLVMGAYIYLGLTRRDTEVTDEKFADSCYYLGFIFTITSIIVSLFDLTQIGTHIQDIAVRFGAAMVSTVLGLMVRVYLVSFQKDVGDAVKEAEGALLDAATRFREQLLMSTERFKAFQTNVEEATASTVSRINMQIEKMTEAHTLRVSEVLNEILRLNRSGFVEGLDEIKSAGAQYTDLVQIYSMGVQRSLDSLDARVATFTDEAAQHLQKTAFPDDYFNDYFIQHMSEPLELLKTATAETTQCVSATASEIAQVSTLLTKALKTFTGKITSTESSMDEVLRITSQQQLVLERAESQITALTALNGTLTELGAQIRESAVALKTLDTGHTLLNQRVESLGQEGSANRVELTAALGQVVAALQANSDLGRLLLEQARQSQTVLETLQQTAASRDSNNSTSVPNDNAAIQELRHLANEVGSLVKTLRPATDPVRGLQGFQVEGAHPSPSDPLPLSVASVHQSATPDTN